MVKKPKAKKATKTAKVSKKAGKKPSTSKKPAAKAKRPATKKAKKATTAKAAKKVKRAAPKKAAVKKAPPKAAPPKKAKKTTPKPKGLSDVAKRDLEMRLETTAISGDASALIDVIERTPETAALNAPFAGQRSKALTVSDCVDAQMVGLGTPNENGHMDTDFGQTEKSMRAFLSGVRDCLAPRFTFDMNGKDFINSCVTATVFDLRLLINGRTR